MAFSLYIESLKGEISHVFQNRFILEVSGVGYALETPFSSFPFLAKKGESCLVWVSTYVREDQLKLYGFLDFHEKEAFEILIGLSGVGPKVALATLSTLSVDQIALSSHKQRL